MPEFDAPLVLEETPTRGVRVLRLNRPERRNALSRDLLRALGDAIASAERDEDIRAVVLCGAGKVFCAGLDLREASTIGDPLDMATRVAGTFVKIATSRLVVVAAVHGAACAGGAGLAVSCDHIVAAESFRIGFPEVRRGLEPALLLPLLKRKVGDAHLRELLLTGRPVSAARAREMGILQEVATDGGEFDAALDYAKATLRGAPEAVARAKAMINATHPTTLGEDLRAAIREHIASWESPSAREGVAAFLEKREPGWRAGNDG